MLKLLDNSGGNLVCFQASGMLTEADYCDVFEVAMKTVLEAHETFRFYADLSALEGLDDTSQWDSGAILADNRDKCEKAAVVGGPSWAGLALMLRDSLPEGSYEFFVDGRHADAIAWVKS
ncbi:MAG: hypothetical protein GKS03_01980 [Alphaproteobacteria bacterium]|nr:hypothetical protein [Alphaproteobacteria bacterium]